MNSQNKLYAEFFWPALPAKRLSITVLQFGSMELDLPTPVSHPPSQGTYPHGRMAYPPPKMCLQVLKMSKIALSYLKNQRKSLTNSLLATVGLSDAKFDIFTGSTNLVSSSFFLLRYPINNFDRKIFCQC